LLEKLIKDYSGTEAAAEAEALLGEAPAAEPETETQ